MDPAPLSKDQWAEVGMALKFLWLALGFAIMAGPSLLIAHAMIPSAVGDKSIDAKWTKLRKPLYAFGTVCLLGIIGSLIMFSRNLNFLEETYSRFWI
ncbi:MAG: hypothetical protein CL740_04565 [Chloroflexi bacterium]|nr:hypothetical protein [Chloroflexota bacterium]|tara:strand:- start:1243 stop:1533 length:291 start_codon:yes stop_codon:yes gene_type:complete